jgi:hypothetical protein
MIGMLARTRVAQGHLAHFRHALQAKTENSLPGASRAARECRCGARKVLSSVPDGRVHVTVRLVPGGPPTSPSWSRE